MKYFKTLKLWKGANCSFNGRLAFSYGWYGIGAVLPCGTVIANQYCYSNTTSKHQGKFMRLAASLFGWNRIVSVRAVHGLHSASAVSQSIEALIAECDTLEQEIANPRKRNKESRREQIAEKQNQIRYLHRLRDAHVSGFEGPEDTAELARAA